MVRPRKINKKPMTSITISEELVRDMLQHKNGGKIWDDFMIQMFTEWKTRKTLEDSYKNLKEENEFLVETLEQTQRKNQEYVEVIEVLKKDKINMESVRNDSRLV